MKEHRLIIIHPGMNLIHTTVWAHTFAVENGGYYFYKNITAVNSDAVDGARVLLCVYPVCSTIINSIK